ncbi:MAG: threonine ammonia-lyase [Rhodobacteraceae bacterium]|nr:threonine ammonia-lyase [Paracoccaceae bacterium]
MNIEMIHSAAVRLQGKVRRTPLLSSPFLDEMAGRRVLVKPECLQHTGSFKYRGGYSAISAMEEQKRKKGVLAYSSGNHAQGVALAARQHNIPSAVIMPYDAPAIKIANTKALGAEVIGYDRVTEKREAIGEKLANERGLTLIKPYDEPEVIAGQGTTGIEIADQAKELGISKADVLVCCGGGGLTSGIALSLAEHAPEMTVYPAEPQDFDDTARSIVRGDHVFNKNTTGNICDAILTPTPGELTFPILKRHCSKGFCVSEEEVLQTMVIAFQRLKLVIEPGGAVALATALFRTEDLTGDTLIAVASGGNVDKEVFARALSEFN